MKIQAQPSPQFEAKWRTYTAAGAAAAAAGFVGNAEKGSRHGSRLKC